MKKARRLEGKGDAAGAESKYLKSYELQQTAGFEKAKLENAIEKQKLENQGRKETAQISAAAQNIPTNLLKEQLARYETELAAEHKAKGLPPPTLAQVQKRMTDATKGYDETQSGRLRTDAITALGKWQERQVTNKNWNKMSEAEQEAATVKQFSNIMTMLQNQAAGASANPTAPAAPTLPKETKGPNGEVLYLNPKDGLYYATKPR
jgi:hypothetical protein